MKEYYVSCDRMKELERATDESGLSYYQMMENAGNIAANRINEITMATRQRPHPSERQLTARIYCGRRHLRYGLPRPSERKGRCGSRGDRRCKGSRSGCLCT